MICLKFYIVCVKTLTFFAFSSKINNKKIIMKENTIVSIGGLKKCKGGYEQLK